MTGSPGTGAACYFRSLDAYHVSKSVDRRESFLPDKFNSLHSRRFCLIQLSIAILSTGDLVLAI
jgi:hypothetical protein